MLVYCKTIKPNKWAKWCDHKKQRVKKGERLDSCGWLNYHITYNCMNPNEDKKSILVFQNKVLTFLSSRIKTIGRS